MNAVAKIEPHSKALTLEQVLIGGDLGKLSAEQRIEYYNKVCESIGLNPLTRPFEYLSLNSKLVLYARRDCADQLRRINGISIAIVSKTHEGDLLTVHVRARDAHGREDEDYGVVSLVANAKGEAAANAVLKCVTKAKRRVTLSISGLGFLDETEVADIPNGRHAAAPTPQRIAPPSPPPAPKTNGNGLTEAEERKLDHTFDPHTGEIIEEAEIEDSVIESDPALAKWQSWGDKAVTAFHDAKTPLELSKMLQRNNERLEKCKTEAAGVYDRVIAAYRARASILSQAPVTPPPANTDDDLPEFLKR